MSTIFVNSLTSSQLYKASSGDETLIRLARPLDWVPFESGGDAPRGGEDVEEVLVVDSERDLRLSALFGVVVLTFDLSLTILTDMTPLCQNTLGDEGNRKGD